MHIVQICQRFFYGHGQEVLVYNLSRELARLGHKITILSSEEDSLGSFKKSLDFPVNVKIKTSKAVRLDYPPNQLLFPHLSQELLEMKNVDIIHAHGAMSFSSLVGLTMAKTKKIPFVFTPLFHPWRFFEQRPYRYTREAYEAVFTAPLIKESSAVIAISPFEKQYLVLRRNLPARKIHVIPSGINVNYYPSIVSRREVRKRLQIPEGKRYIITFGVITDARKGLDRSLKIFDLINKKMPNTHLLIVGWKYKENADALANLMDSLPCKNNISPLGYVSEDEKIALIKMSDVLISSTTYEAFGIVLGEALILETPSVVTSVGGTPSIVKHGETGFTVNNFNSINKFAQLSLRLLNNEKLRLGMAKRGQKLVKRYFTWHKIAKDVNRIYLRLTE